MTIRALRLRVPAWLALLAICAATSAAAQKSKPAPAKTTKAGTSAAANGKVSPYRGVAPDKLDAAASHEMLVMAHRDNLVTFTKALRGIGTPTAPVNVVVARPAMAEMKRSYEELMRHHEAQLEELAGHVDAGMTAGWQRLDARLGRIGQHLKALDLAVNDPTPDPKEVAMRSAEILKECAALSSLRAKATR